MIWLKIFITILLFQYSQSEYHTELSIIVELDLRECLHQHLPPNLNMEADFQVKASGELDVSFWVCHQTSIFSYGHERSIC